MDSKGVIDKNSVLNNKDYSISTLALNQQIMILEKVEELLEGSMFFEWFKWRRQDKRSIYSTSHG